jgi:hypothetical protein
VSWVQQTQRVLDPRRPAPPDPIESPAVERDLEEEVHRYVRTGEHDNLLFFGWRGHDLGSRARHAREALASALGAEVRKRAPHAQAPSALRGLDVTAFTRATVAPMVRGLFPRSEQQRVLDLLAGSVVSLTPANVESILRQVRWPHTAWMLANLYLSSFGAEMLSEEAESLLGLSEETTCYVSVEYFTQRGRFEDLLVHEAAHVFHNCKRQTIGLNHTRRREWILEIDYAKRETFAHACQAYSCIVALGKRPAERRALLSELERERLPREDRVDPGEYVDILREAVAARNGWKRILARCAPVRQARREGSTGLAV